MSVDPERYQKVAEMYKPGPYGQGNPIGREFNVSENQYEQSANPYDSQMGGDYQGGQNSMANNQGDAGDLENVDLTIAFVFGMANFMYSLACESSTVPLDKRTVALQSGVDNSLVSVKQVLWKGMQKAMITSVFDTLLKTTNGSMVGSPARMLMFVGLEYPMQTMFNRTVSRAAQLKFESDEDQKKTQTFIDGNLWHNLETTIKEEDMGALYRGLVPYTLSNAINVFEPFDTLVGLAAWTIGSTAISYPLLTVSVRMQTDRKKKYANMFDCFNQILNEEGPTALYAGIGSQMLRWATTSAVTLGLNFAFGRVLPLLFEEE